VKIVSLNRYFVIEPGSIRFILFKMIFSAFRDRVNVTVSEVLTAALLKIEAFWDVALCC
jgi:hypothetical protein